MEEECHDVEGEACGMEEQVSDRGARSGHIHVVELLGEEQKTPFHAKSYSHLFFKIVEIEKEDIHTLCN